MKKCSLFFLMFALLSAGCEPKSEDGPYTITIVDDGNGTAVATLSGAVVTTAEKGERIMISATPNEGYMFDKWSTESQGFTITYELEATTVFTMPAGNVVIKAEFVTHEEFDVLPRISDPAFRAWCKKAMDNEYTYGDTGRTHPAWDTDNDGRLSLVEAEAVTAVWFMPSAVSSLDGIEYFSGLKMLYCAVNQLRSLDLSKNTKLIHLDCSINAITSLDVSNCTELRFLDFGYNGLRSIDISKNIVLQTLILWHNSLTSLDISNNQELRELECSHNDIESLDIPQNTGLTYMACANNHMRTLNISNMTWDFDGEYVVVCGNQTTTNGFNPRTLTLTMREDQRSFWESTLAHHESNANVVVAD